MKDAKEGKSKRKMKTGGQWSSVGLKLGGLLVSYGYIKHLCITLLVAVVTEQQFMPITRLFTVVFHVSKCLFISWVYFFFLFSLSLGKFYLLYTHLH